LGRGDTGFGRVLDREEFDIAALGLEALVFVEIHMWDGHRAEFFTWK
jgi:hypothetical protein